MRKTPEISIKLILVVDGKETELVPRSDVPYDVLVSAMNLLYHQLSFTHMLPDITKPKQIPEPSPLEAETWSLRHKGQTLLVKIIEDTKTHSYWKYSQFKVEHHNEYFLCGGTSFIEKWE